MKIGTLALKIAGRDGNNWCVIVDKIDDNYVLIDGNVRRKKCNIKHLEATEKILKIKKGASSDEVKKALEHECIKVIKKGEKKAVKTKLTKKRKMPAEKKEANKEVKKEVKSKTEKEKKKK